MSGNRRHWDKIQRYTSFIAIALAGVSFVLLIAFSLNKPPTAAPLPPPPTEDIRLPTLPPGGSARPPTPTAAADNPSPPDAPDADLAHEVEQIDNEVEALNRRLDALDERLAALERTLVDEPGKAVELAVLRRDLANLESRHDSEMKTLQEQTRRELDTLRNLTWLIVAGLLSGLVSVFIQARRHSPHGGAGEG
jgi:hypothetical protein